MSSDFVKKATGEVFKVEDTGLANICDGDLDFVFKQELRKLAKEMSCSDKGKITINVDITCFEDANGYTCYAASGGVKTTYPKISTKDIKVKYLQDDGRVVQRKTEGLFMKEDEDDVE